MLLESADKNDTLFRSRPSRDNGSLITKLHLASNLRLVQQAQHTQTHTRMYVYIGTVADWRDGRYGRLMENSYDRHRDEKYIVLPRDENKLHTAADTESYILTKASELQRQETLIQHRVDGR